MAKNRAEYEKLIDKLSSSTNESIDRTTDASEHEKDAASVPLINSSINNKEESPYEEVAANISNKDDTTTPCITFRSIVIGTLLTCVMAFTSQFFALRTSPLDLNIGVVILIAYMLGLLMAFVLPKKVFCMTLNSGPFNLKELALITIMATSGLRTYQGIETLFIQRTHYRYHMGHVSGVLFLIIMHFLAISIAGILKEYLIKPGFMIWPSTLMNCALMRTLIHEDDFRKDDSRWKMSRLKFFWLMVLFQFLWYWFPGYIFPLLSFFSIVCVMAPKNIILSQVTGAYGLGIGALEFDWNSCVAYLDSPILVPFWAHVNFFLGFVAVLWVATPIIYYTNIWDTKRMPIISNRVFDKNGLFFHTSKVLTEDGLVNKTAYETYGPVYITAGSCISIGFTFAAVSALLVHTILYHGKEIVEYYRSNSSTKTEDIHAKLMSNYPEVSLAWYFIMLCMTFLAALLFCYFTEVLPTHLMPVSLLLTLIFALPNGIIRAITNLSTTSSLLSDIISSQLLLGNPNGYLAFRTFTYTCQDQIIIYLMNQKIGHYMKVPPRIIFLLYIIGSILYSLIQYMTAIYLLNYVPNICTAKNPVWKCLNLENTYTSSILFSVAGSFNVNSQYSSMLYGFLLGAVLPFISWLLWKMFPRVKWLALVNFPIFLTSTNAIPPAPAAEYPTWFLVGFIFNFVLYRYTHAWWEKYALIFSAAMSCGVALCGYLIFFIFQLNRISFPQWWGLGGITGDGCPLASGNFSGFIANNSYT